MNNAQDIEVESLGDYKVLSYLRRTVWCQDILAEHRFIKKRYILKLLHPEMTSSEAFMNVFHEAVVRLATLKHSGIVTIENVSQVNGQYFLVTEDKEIPTCSLSQYLSSKTEGLGELEIYDFVEQLAQILDYVHGHGLVHGNLNLDSVHVDLSGNMTRIFLPELGFSFLLKEHALRHILHECPEGSYFTQLKQATLFQAPEIPSGTVEEDTYAFGVIVYFLLFRRLPQGMFPLPSEIFPGYLYDWDGLLHSCLHYSPEQRPKKLVSILKKKVLGEQLLNVKMQCVDETRDSHQEIENPQVFSLMKEGENIVESIDVTAPAFVLVEAKSIDEAMNTSLDSVEDGDKEEESYSHALQSLLVREPIVSRYVEEEKEETQPQPLFTEMVFISGGEFTRGSREGQRDEHPVHTIVLPGFFLDIHPVTNEQFVRYLEYTGSEQDKHYNELIRLKDSRIQRRSGKLVIEPGYAKHPVVGVTWYGASEYAAWLGKRLPTEAEWEIAAYGGISQQRYPCGEEIDKTQANFFSSDTTAVMSYPANSYGLYDMAGNVYEWCHDWYGYDFYEVSSQESHSPQGPAQGVYRVLRGGCWKSLKGDLRCSHRHRNNPGVVNSTYGFRCAKGVK
ncbi:SUMF1/EgtB/PvdO family nonheme iron enzyme [Chlamydia gallinacea]|uniref:non-specific serine/threonine protein kinase n=2 Tax=Chlamydia gallinacea TaxID=1457153 RepID=A0A173E0D6_9CHLA|nr:SUMF1/EgtB/PvdO family nonheme iron enzyme [Chlamydia gallinacea]EYE60248.1 serine/threonine-protein kinase pkn1 [Bacteroides fragilis str. S6L5]ANG66603.1 serine/threonine protein kinase [Chlamydia gallinacea 08-1274/3]AQT77224.1 serine/threonine protein kinase [Chlamydia gallinacea]MBX6679953.1 SUMF1/EgtB/PvdO family nonheme iron enzyme [Chlamydia gallinacea]MBX6687175.1 SUMF1/EgtB/PvdO family nonheme iron enzyme [Chlamydia gallinacea]